MNRKISKDEEKKMSELITLNGENKQVERLISRRKSKKSYEYEVKVSGISFALALSPFDLRTKVKLLVPPVGWP